MNTPSDPGTRRSVSASPRVGNAQPKSGGDQDLFGRDARTPSAESAAGVVAVACVALAMLVALSAGCASARRHVAPDEAAVAAPHPVAAPLAEGPPAVRTWAALNHSLADALRGAGKSCEKVARALDSWTRANGEAFRSATAAMDAWEVRANRTEARHYHELAERDVEARIEAGVRCDSDPGARAAFDRFFSAVGFDGRSGP